MVVWVPRGRLGYTGDSTANGVQLAFRKFHLLTLVSVFTNIKLLAFVTGNCSDGSQDAVVSSEFSPHVWQLVLEHL